MNDSETQARDDLVMMYVQGRLNSSERSAFEARMKNDPALHAEVTALQTARDAMAEDLPEDAEASWTQFSQRLDDAPDGVATNAPFRPTPANLNRPVKLWQAALAAAACVAIWQVAAVPLIPPQTGADFRPVTSVSEGFVLQVLFAENVAISEVNALLYDLDASVIDGPGALGLYHLAFPDEQSRDAALAALQSSSLVATASKP